MHFSFPTAAIVHFHSLATRAGAGTSRAMASAAPCSVPTVCARRTAPNHRHRASSSSARPPRPSGFARLGRRDDAGECVVVRFTRVSVAAAETSEETAKNDAAADDADAAASDDPLHALVGESLVAAATDLKTTELKARLAAMGVSATGLKPTLVDRLVACVEMRARGEDPAVIMRARALKKKSAIEDEKAAAIARRDARRAKRTGSAEGAYALSKQTARAIRARKQTGAKGKTKPRAPRAEEFDVELPPDPDASSELVGSSSCAGDREGGGGGGGGRNKMNKILRDLATQEELVADIAADGGIDGDGENHQSDRDRDSRDRQTGWFTVAVPENREDRAAAQILSLSDTPASDNTEVKVWVPRVPPRDYVASESEARSIHWSPYDRVGVVNADP